MKASLPARRITGYHVQRSLSGGAVTQLRLSIDRLPSHRAMVMQ